MTTNLVQLNPRNPVLSMATDALLPLPFAESTFRVGEISQGTVSQLAYTAAVQDAVLSASTQRMEQSVAQLRNPLSPASLLAITHERTVSEILFDATASAKILTAQVAMHLDREWRQKLFAQLDSLHDPDEWQEGDQPVQQASFATFLKAMFALKPKRRPGLGLSFGGHLIAAWTSGRNRLTIEFQPNDRVRWVISRYPSNELEQDAGRVHVADLAGRLQPHHPEEWFD